MGRVYDFTKKKFVDDDEDRYEVKKRSDGTMSIVRNAQSASPRLADQWRSDPTMAEAKSAIKSGKVAEFNSAQVRMKRPTLPTVFPAKTAKVEPVRPVVKREGLMLPTSFVPQGRTAVPKHRAEQQAKAPGIAWAQGAPTAPVRPVQKGQGLLAKYFPSPYDRKREQAAAGGAEQKGQGLLGQYIKPPHVREAEQREAMEQIKAGVRFEDLLGKQTPLTNTERIIANHFIKEREKQYRAKLAASMAQLQSVSEEDQAFSMQTTALKDRISGAGAFVKGGVNALSLGGLDRAGRKQDEAARALSGMLEGPATQAAREVADSHNGKSVAQIAKEENPLAYGAGSFAGETAKYLAYAPLIEGIALVGKAAQSAGGTIAKLTGGKISTQVATNLVSGRIVDLPFDVVNAVQNTDNPGDFVKSVAGDQALGLLTDGAVEGLAFGWKQIKAAQKNGQLRKIMDADAIKDADIDAYLEKQHGGDVAKSKTIDIPARSVAQNMSVTDPNNMKRYRVEIDGVFNGNLPSGEDILLGKTPDILVRHGAPNISLHMNQSTARKIAYPTGYQGLKHGHNLGLSVLKNLPYQLENPVAVLKNPQPNGKGLESLVVLTEWYDEKGLRIVTPIHLSAQGAVETQNNVASTFGADYLDALLGENNQNVIYTKNNEDIRQLLSTGVNSPKATADDIFDADSISSFKTKINGSPAQNASTAFDAVSAPLRVAEEARARMQGQSLPTEFGTKTAAQGLPTEFGQNTVGAAQMNPTSYEHLQNEYRSIPQGEKPRAREVDVPNSTDGTDRVSKYARTLMEAPATSDEMVAQLEQMVAHGELSHDVLGDKQALQSALDTVTLKGMQGAYDQWQDVARGLRSATKEDMAMGQLLYAEFVKAGDVAHSGRMAAELAAEATRAGQTVQAMCLLKKTTPEGQAYYLQRAADVLTEKMAPRLGGKKIVPDAKLMKQLAVAKTTAERDAAVKLLQQNIAGQVPVTWWDKFDAWRYVAMLANPRTHSKNLAGNTVFIPARKIKDSIAWALEQAGGVFSKKFGQKDMTKAFLNPFGEADKALKEFGRNDFAVMKDVVADGGKYDELSGFVNDNRKVFTSKLFTPVEWLREHNGAWLDNEDAWFSKPAYADALAQCAKARGYSAKFLAGGTREANTALNAIRKVAVFEAQKATYRDASALADGLNKLKNMNRATKIIGGGVLPFTKTPINVVKRGLEYSPAGILKNLFSDLPKLKAGEISAAQFIDSLASTLTGTGACMLGWWLAKEGHVTGVAGEGKEGDFAELQGRQNYAVNIGGKSFTIDWMAPSVLPVMVGAEVFRLQEQSGKGDTVDTEDVMEAMVNIVEPVFDLTMLDGVNSTIRAADEARDSVARPFRYTIMGGEDIRKMGFGFR